MPAGGTINWTNGFLPARHQGSCFAARGRPSTTWLPAQPDRCPRERAARELLATMNAPPPGPARVADDALVARVRSYELAAKMQLAVPEVTDLDGETAATHALYGSIERSRPISAAAACWRGDCWSEGVRFVQLFSGGSFGNPRINWDGHENMRANHGQEAPRIDRPVAGLLRDLRQRGMLDDTLVLFTTEFGRTPFTQSAADVVGLGRDHNQYGFTVWMAGAGLRHGMTYGRTDDFGYKAVEKPVAWHDFHATVLHLLGIDHERLTFYHNGIQRRLTNVHGMVLHDLLV